MLVERLLVEVEGLAAVLVDLGAVLHDAGDVDRRVVGGVGVAVGDRGDAVPAERVRLVGHDEGVDVEVRPLGAYAWSTASSMDWAFSSQRCSDALRS